MSKAARHCGRCRIKGQRNGWMDDREKERESTFVVCLLHTKRNENHFDFMIDQIKVHQQKSKRANEIDKIENWEEKSRKRERVEEKAHYKSHFGCILFTERTHKAIITAPPSPSPIVLNLQFIWPQKPNKHKKISESNTQI